MRTSQRFQIISVLLLFMVGSITWVSAAGQGGTGAAADEDIHIEGWMAWGPSTVPDDPQFGDHVMWKVAEEKFGIYIDWTTVASEGKSALGLLIASGDLPDLIGRSYGATVAQDYGRQGAFMQLENLIAENGPNLTGIMNEFPAYRGQTVGPDGHIYFFPRIMEPLVRNFPGYQIRQDWLDKFGLDMPDNVDELGDALRTFLNEDANGNGERDEVPWTYDPRSLIWPFGVGSRGYNSHTDLFVEDGVIKNGTTDPRFKEGITMVAQWYAEGLIDPEYLGQKGSQRDALVLANRVGSILGSYAGFLTKYNKLFTADGHDDWKFVALPAPKGPTGIRNMMGKHNSIDKACGASIPIGAEHPEAITEMLDYFYSDEGRMHLYFGEEGKHHTVQDGVPVYTDLITKHPDLSIYQVLNTYVGYISAWPSYIPGIHQLSLYDQEGKDALYLSAKHETDRKIPNLQFTAGEIREVQEIARDLNTFTDEWVHGFIRGLKSIDNDWDEFQAGLEKLKNDRYVELHNAAYTRYKAVLAGG